MIIQRIIIPLVICFFLIVPIFCQANEEGWYSKIYSGYFQKEVKHKIQVNKTILGYVRFQCPSSSLDKPVVEIPDQLSYFIGFRNDGKTAVKNPFEEGRSFIKIYSNDDEEHNIDFNKEPQSINHQAIPAPEPDELEPGQSVERKYYLNDTYIKYLILSKDIKFIVIFNDNSKKEENGFVLDKFSIDEGK